MSDEPTNYAAFRRRLDGVLRQRDPAALTAFLVAEGQWDASGAHDAEAALWMMVAASPALKDMRNEAEHWLLTHGHETEARAILGNRKHLSAGTQRASQHPSPQSKPTKSAPPSHAPTPRKRPAQGKRPQLAPPRTASVPKKPRPRKP